MKVPRYDKPVKPFFSFSYFVSGKSGYFSKRAFFFSVFAGLSVVYVVYAAVTQSFDRDLGLFLLGANAAFGLNYYQNERGSKDDVQ